MKIRILYINNDGAGFAEHLTIDSGTTVRAFFNERYKGQALDYLIRVNRQPVASDYILVEGDRITITPTKIEGAVCLS